MRATLQGDAVRAAALALFAERGYRGTTMADIGAAVGVRGPSLYRVVSGKQDLLVELMVGTMQQLIRIQADAAAAGGDPGQVLRRMVEGHVRFHAANREQAFVGNREIENLDPPNRDRVLRLRGRYEQRLRAVIIAGQEQRLWTARSARLASYAILDMGIGVATWFRADGPHTVDEVAFTYADYAVGLLRSAV